MRRKNKVFVWRVENDIGESPFLLGRQHKLDFGVWKILRNYIHRKETILRLKKDKNYLASPGRDVGIERSPKSDEICACLTKQQIRKWFPKHIMNLLEPLGFYVKKIKVKKITAYGEKQILCIR